MISGPLGTLVGLYETAVDKLCSWEVSGKTVSPKVIASTATIRKAADQVYATFLRKVSIFPPQGLDVRDNFFSRQTHPSEDSPGRRIPRHLCFRSQIEGCADTRVCCAALSFADALREKRLRQRG